LILTLILILMDEKVVATERHQMCWQWESQAGPWHLRKVLRQLGCDIQFTMIDCVSHVAEWNESFDLEGYEETVAASLFRDGEDHGDRLRKYETKIG
jgi:hypothetical protein